MDREQHSSAGQPHPAPPLPTSGCPAPSGTAQASTSKSRAPRSRASPHAERFDIQIVFKEVESGKDSDALDRRPELAAALADARRPKCPVIVAKLDRLSHDVQFIGCLLAQRVTSIFANWTGGVDPFMLTLFVALAENERAPIYVGTKDAQAADKERGVEFGTPRLAEASSAGASVIKAGADASAASILHPASCIQSDRSKHKATTLCARSRKS